MPKENHKIRSKEVQEMLSTAPNLFIKWGNVILIALLLGFIWTLRTSRLQQRSDYSIRVSNVYTKAGIAYIETYFNMPLPKGFPKHSCSTLSFATDSIGTIVKVPVSSNSASYAENKVTFQVKKGMSNQSVDGQLINGLKGMFGKCSIQKDSMTMFNLFVQKLKNK